MDAFEGFPGNVFVAEAQADHRIPTDVVVSELATMVGGTKSEMGVLL